MLVITDVRGKKKNGTRYIEDIQENASSKDVQGPRIARDAPMLNHLLFADDGLIFVKDELRQLANLKQLLNCYERLAGQKINFSKS